MYSVFCIRVANSCSGRRKGDLGEYRHVQDPEEMEFSVEGDAYRKLKDVAGRNGVTLNAVLQYAWHKTLSVYGNSETTIVGTVVSGRNLPIGGIETSVGLFINTLPLIMRHGEGSVLEQLGELQGHINEINSHSNVSLGKLQKGGRRLFDSLFVYENYPVPSRTEDDRLKIEFKRSIEKMDYPLGIVVYESDHNILFTLQYPGELFKEERIKQLLETVEHVLMQVIANIIQDSKSLSYISPTIYQSLVYDWNKTEKEYPHDKTINELFEEQVERTPNNIAVVYEEERLTYQELKKNRDLLAQEIRKAYEVITHEVFKPELIIGVYGLRSITFFSAMLGIFKAGGVHLPLDPTYPSNRIAQILIQSKVRFILVAKAQEAALRSIVETLENSSLIQVWIIEDMLAALPDGVELKSIAMPDNLAYLMYTSGSTGLPKGAMVEHKGMVNHLYAKLNDVGATGADVFVQNASQCFDVSVFQFIAMLVLGGCIVVVDDETAYDPIRLINCAIREGVTLLEVVPSMIRILIDTLQTREDMRFKLSGLRWLVSTGDALLPELCDQWFALYPNTPILNTYGPTECSDDVMHYPVYKSPQNKEAIVPIGKPIQNMKMYVLNRGKQPVPVGVLGELYIGGLGVGRGYLNDPERTADAFMLNPFVDSSVHNRLYKTGDLVKYLGDGNIEFVGRLNSQIKIRGFRVGLGEIESTLRQHKDVKECVVIVSDSGGEKQLVSYYVLGQKEPNTDIIGADTLRQYLKAQLPEYMVPAYFVALEALPLNSNGKIDKKRLPELHCSAVIEDTAHVLPQSKTEHVLVEVLQNVLKLKKVSTQSHFFDIGGDSLAAVRYKFKIDKEFLIDLPLSVIFKYPTIETLAKLIDEQRVSPEINTDLYQVEEF